MRNDTELRSLIERAQKFDTDALSLIYEGYFDRVYRYALARVRNREIAEDLAGQTFLRLVERIGDFQWRGGGFNAWLFRIVHNLTMDWFRERREQPTADVEAEIDLQGRAPGPEEAVLADEALQAALSALDELSEPQKQVLLLRLVAGLSGRETAEALGLSEVNVRTLQHRALSALKDKLRVVVDA